MNIETYWKLSHWIYDLYAWYRTLLNVLKWSNGAQGRNRTGTVLPPRDFLTNYSFCCCHRRHLWPGLSLHHVCIHKFRRVPSSLYTFLNNIQASLGIATIITCWGFPEFDTIHRKVSYHGAQYSKSLASTNFATWADGLTLFHSSEIAAFNKQSYVRMYTTTSPGKWMRSLLVWFMTVNQLQKSVTVAIYLNRLG